MKRVEQRYVSVVSLALVLGATFAACGGLDPRKVTRGSDEPMDRGGEGNEPKPGAGGSEHGSGGAGSSPFGGEQGYDGGAPPVIDEPPTVVQVSPGDDAEDVEPNDDVGLRFSEGLDPETVSLDNIKLMDGDTEIEGELSYEGVDALFEPSRRLSLLATYDVSVSTGVTDAGGIAMAEPFTSRFTVRDGRWSALTQAFDDQENWGGSQDIGIAANGNALVVYTRFDPAIGNVQAYARWYRVSGGWQPEKALEPNVATTGVTGGLRVAVSPEGDAVAAWWVQESSSYRLRALRYSGGSWEAEPQYVEQSTITAPNDVFPDAIALAARAGRVVIAWVRGTYQKVSPYNYYYDLMLSSAGIDEPWPEYPASNYTVTYSAPYYASLGGLQAVIDDKGNALMTFFDRSGQVAPTYGGGIYYARKPADDDNWQYPVKIANTDNLVEQVPQLASDGSGAMLVWSNAAASGGNRMLASRYTVAKQFGAPVEIGDPELTDTIHVPQGHALASDGRSFHATWAQFVGSSRNAYVQRFDIATGKWAAAPTPISDGVARVDSAGAIGVDGHGNAIATFEQYVGQYDTIIMGARFRASTGEWSTAEPLTEAGHGYGTPQLSIAANGIAALLFRGGGRDNGQNVPSIGAQLLSFK